MTSWSIQTDGVAAVLRDVQISAEELGTAIESINAAQTTLNLAAGGILSPAALATLDLVESQQSRVNNIATRIPSCVLGATQAASAYVHGDEEMATQTRSAAVQAASSGNLSFFEGTP